MTDYVVALKRPDDTFAWGCIVRMPDGGKTMVSFAHERVIPKNILRMSREMAEGHAHKGTFLEHYAMPYEDLVVEMMVRELL